MTSSIGVPGCSCSCHVVLAAGVEKRSAAREQAAEKLRSSGNSAGVEAAKRQASGGGSKACIVM